MTTCSIGAFLGIGIYKNEDKFYDKCLMPIVRLCSPELCHRAAVLGFKYKLFPRQKESDPDRLVSAFRFHYFTKFQRTFFFQRIRFLDFDLTNPVGIAAGFDKHGEAVEGLHRSGFGFIEIGSVTPEPQPGNDKPRVFRLIDDKAIINRSV